MDKLLVSPSPHLHTKTSTKSLMRDVVIALLPAVLVSVLFYGWSELLVLGVSVASCVLLEFLITKYLLKKSCTVGDMSAVVTGILLALNLPATTPWWVVFIGAVVAIGVAKMTFGGLGKNPFNPALVGRVFLLIAYPAQMTTFPAPKIEGFVDSFSGATPLAAAKAQMVDYGSFDMLGMFNGAMAGSVGEIATLALLLGFGYLLWRKVITWHIPVAVLGTMALFAAVYGAFSFDTPHLVLNFSVFHLLAGGAVLGAVYMATDYATSPMTTRGMVIYGVGIGVLTMCIRLWGSYPEGMSFAILIMNAVVPLINKYVKPKRFGLKK